MSSQNNNYINNYNSLYDTSKILQKTYYNCIKDNNKKLINKKICDEYKKDYMKYMNMCNNTDYTL